MKRKPRGAEFRALDRVSTLRGEGVIKYVYPRGPRGKNAYCVNFGNRRVGVIFHEDELVPLGTPAPASRPESENTEPPASMTLS